MAAHPHVRRPIIIGADQRADNQENKKGGEADVVAVKGVAGIPDGHFIRLTVPSRVDDRPRPERMNNQLSLRRGATWTVQCRRNRTECDGVQPQSDDRAAK